MRRGVNLTQHDQPGNAGGPPPDAILMQMLFGALMTQSICVAAKLGIADLLAEQPQTAAELAAKTKTHEPSLYRVLRTPFGDQTRESGEGAFDNSPLATSPLERRRSYEEFISNFQ